MASGIVKDLAPSSALSLGIVRTALHSVFLISVLTTSFSTLGDLPVTVLRPLGVMKLLPWAFYDHLLTPTSMILFKWTMFLSLLLSAVGYLTAWSTKSSLLLVVFYQGLVRSFGHFNHDEMIAVYGLAVLAFSPCGDAFSLDAWSGRTKEKGSGSIYDYPILLMRLLVAWVYFSSALVKLRVAGWKYFAADNLPALAIYHSLDNLHNTHFRLAFGLPGIRTYLPYAVGAVLLWELLFPLAVFMRRLRWWILGFGVVFHCATVFLMNVFFPYHLLMYLVFVDWNGVAERIRRRRLSATHDQTTIGPIVTSEGEIT